MALSELEKGTRESKKKTAKMTRIGRSSTIVQKSNRDTSVMISGPERLTEDGSPYPRHLEFGEDDLLDRQDGAKESDVSPNLGSMAHAEARRFGWMSPLGASAAALDKQKESLRVSA